MRNLSNFKLKLDQRPNLSSGLMPASIESKCLDSTHHKPRIDTNSKKVILSD